MKVFKFGVGVMILTLIGCGGSEVKPSKHDLLTSGMESFNYTGGKPKLISVKERKIIAQLPPLRQHPLLTFDNIDISDSSSSITIVSLTQDLALSKVKLNMRVASRDGNIYLGRKCTQSGFFSCKSWSDMVYRLKDLNTSKTYKLDEIINLDFNKSKRIDAYSIFNERIKRIVSEDTYSGTMRYRDSDVSILKLKYLNSNEFSFVFENVDNIIKRFNLKEGYAGGWNFSTIDLSTMLANEEKLEQEQLNRELNQLNLTALSLPALSEIYKRYYKFDVIKSSVAKAYYERALSLNSIEILHHFNETFSEHIELVEKSTHRIFKHLLKINSVAGFEWFLTNYSRAKDAASAVKFIHQHMYEKAQKIGNLSAYNTFIFSYPMSDEAKLASEQAAKIESGLYADIGFFTTDDDKEKMARRLLIAAKQIERIPRENNLKRKESSGYYIVANRMYELLQQNYVESDATLRHLESKEFKDFTSEFISVMKDVNKILLDIRENTRSISQHTKELLTTSKQGVENAKADRALNAYYTKQHRDWEKNMHFLDKGYM